MGVREWRELQLVKLGGTRALELAFIYAAYFSTLKLTVMLKNHQLGPPLRYSEIVTIVICVPGYSGADHSTGEWSYNSEDLTRKQTHRQNSDGKVLP